MGRLVEFTCFYNNDENAFHANFASDSLALLFCWIDSVDSNLARKFWDYTNSEASFLISYPNTPHAPNINPYNHEHIVADYAAYQSIIDDFHNTLYPILDSLGEKVIYDEDNPEIWNILKAIEDDATANDKYWISAFLLEIESFYDGNTRNMKFLLKWFEKLYQCAIDNTGEIWRD
ncbi:MAG: hypothetical protein H6607_04885 [Flavobacteriales bacterium]|nr:hypothetical protein [Flavobacteriales bacterium]